MTEKLFQDRRDAGRRLAGELAEYQAQQPLILALPRGGVPVADEVAQALRAPLDLLFVRKIGAPDQAELAVAAVVDGDAPALVKNDDIVRLLRVDEDYLERQKEKMLKEIARRRAVYMGERPPTPVAGRTVIVVDDGIATGASVRAALSAVRRNQPARLVLATPVAPPDALAEIEPLCDAIVALYQPTPFMAISPYYREFPQLSDDEVLAILNAAREREQSTHARP